MMTSRWWTCVTVSHMKNIIILINKISDITDNINNIDNNLIWTSVKKKVLIDVSVNNLKPWPRGQRYLVRVRMTGISLGRSSRLLRCPIPMVRSGRGHYFHRARTPRLRIQWGPSASHLHKGRVRVFGPTPPTIKSDEVKRSFLCVFPLFFLLLSGARFL